MKKQAPVYTFDVRFTGKQAKAIEAVARARGITPEAMVRQAVREALDKASGKGNENGMENYVLNLLSRGARLNSSQRQELEQQVLTTLRDSADGPPRRKPAAAPRAKSVKTAAATKTAARTSAARTPAKNAKKKTAK